MSQLTSLLLPAALLRQTSAATRRTDGELLIVLVRTRIRLWVQGRYLGFWWWLLEPLAMTLTYMFLVSIAFRAKTPHSALFLMCAVLPWAWLTSATSSASHSLRCHAAVLKSVAVNYVLFPTAEVLASAIRFLASLLILFLLIAYYRIPFSGQILWLPVLILVQLLLVLGLSYWLALAQVYVEDTVNAWQVACRIWFLLSPSIFAVDRVPPAWQSWMLLNPLAVIFCSYRNVLMYGRAPELPYLALTLLLGALLIVSGNWLLQRARGSVPAYL